MKKLYFIAALLAMVTSASAQVQKTGTTMNGDVRMIPRLLTYGDNMYIYTENSDSFTIYNDDIEKVHSFEVSGYVHEYRYEYQQRKNQPTIEVVDTRMSKLGIYDDETHEQRVFTWEEAKKYVLEEYASYKWEESYGYKFYPKDESDYFSTYDKNTGTYDYYDYKYPEIYWEWNPDDGYLYQVYANYKQTNHYTGEWETIRAGKGSTGRIFSPSIIDYDGISDPEHGTAITQTLFNKDEKFEYICLEYDDNATIISEEKDRDEDGEIDYRCIEYGGVRTGISIVQEDGTVLQTIDGGYVYDIIIINGKFYMVVEEEKGSYYSVIYRIDPQTNSVKRINTPLGMVVRPSVADRNEQVTVELDSDAREIQIVNAAGQTIKRIPVSEGQRQVNFNTRGLGSGVNVVRATGRDAQSSRKFIVK